MSKRWKTTRPVLVGDPEHVIYDHHHTLDKKARAEHEDLVKDAIDEVHSRDELTNREWTDPVLRGAWERMPWDQKLADNPTLGKPVIQGNGPHGTNEEYDFEESDLTAGLDDLSDEAFVSQDGPQQ